MAKFHSLQFLCLALLVSMAAATQFRVGGSKGWTVPTEPNAMPYNHWAQSHRFHIGDSLLFVYPPDQDSVLLVDETTYKTCNTSSHIDIFDDGNTVFTLTRSGTFYFISGNHENCLKNESLIVVVMASRSNATIATAPSPPPSPSSLAPPPPPETLVHTPASSPVVQPTSPPSPSGVSSSKVLSFMSSFGALLGVFISFVL